MTNAFKPSESPSVDNIQTVGCRTVVQVRGQELVEEQRWRSGGGRASLQLRGQMKIRVPLNGSVLLRIATFRSSAAALYRGPHGCDSI